MTKMNFNGVRSFGVGFVLTFFAGSQVAYGTPPGPTPQVPAGGGPPGPFPNTSVSGVNVIAKGSTTFDSNVEITEFNGNGPIAWTVTKYNRGDFAMRLSPPDSAAANANTLNKGFIDFTSADDASLAENQSWKPHSALGVSMPTAIQNGPIDWGDGEGSFYPTVAMGNASSGRGYHMVDGTFGTGQLDIQTGRAGTHDSSPEANFSFSVTWFPYDQGWLAGNVGNPTADGTSVWDGAGYHAAGLAAGMVRWIEVPTGSATYGGLAELRLPGVNPMTNGMLFATSSHGNSDVNIVGVAPVVDEFTAMAGWIVTVREDSALTGDELAASSQSNFEFVYIPYTAKNLIGGYINGVTGEKIVSAGDFTITRAAAGTYELTVPGKTGSQGTLLMQVADVEEGTTQPTASRAFMSYEYNAGSGKFVIQVRKLSSNTVADLVDANFYVTWVDFATPLAPPDGPRMRVQDAVRVTDDTLMTAKEANLGVNTHEAEILVTSIDDQNSNLFNDPVLGILAQQTVVGYFYNPLTLTMTRGPFLILGNASGQFNRHDVKYNPVTKEYNVVGCARTYEPGVDLLMIARVNPNSKAGENEPLINAFVFDGLTNGMAYDDVALAVATNGNFIVVAEHKFADEGEGTVGILFSGNGTPLTPPARLDVLQGAGDEDDPDVSYLPSKDVFLYISNTDQAGGLVNRVVGSVIQTTASNGQLEVSGPEQLLAVDSGPTQGHPAAFENPFNGEVITAFDTGGNNMPTGELSFYNIGAGPTFTFSQARPQVPYLNGSEGNPLRHQHPQLAADPNSGVIVVGYQARDSSVGNPNGYVFNVLDANGSPMPSQLGAPYYLADAAAGIDTGANFHNIKYSPISDSFIAVFAANGLAGAPRAAYIAGLTITSSQSAGEVSLTASLRDGKVIISWPTSASGYHLEMRDALTGGAWTSVQDQPVINGENFEVSVTPGTIGFYRLSQ